MVEMEETLRSLEQNLVHQILSLCALLRVSRGALLTKFLGRERGEGGGGEESTTTNTTLTRPVLGEKHSKFYIGTPTKFLGAEGTPVLDDYLHQAIYSGDVWLHVLHSHMTQVEEGELGHHEVHLGGGGKEVLTC